MWFLSFIVDEVSDECTVDLEAREVFLFVWLDAALIAV